MYGNDVNFCNRFVTIFSQFEVIKDNIKNYTNYQHQFYVNELAKNQKKNLLDCYVL